MHLWHLKWVFSHNFNISTYLIFLHEMQDRPLGVNSRCKRHHTEPLWLACSHVPALLPVLCVKAKLSLKSKWFCVFFFSLSFCLPPVHIQHEGQVPGKRPTRPQQQLCRKLEEHCLLSLQSKATPHPRLVPTAQTSFTPGLPILAMLIFDACSPTQLIKGRPCIM